MPLDPIEQIIEIDEVLDDLSSPSTLEVFEAMLPYEGGMVTAAAARRALNAGGGSGSQTLAEVLDEGNDADGASITGLADPTDDQDAATKKYVDDNSGGGGNDGAVKIVGPFEVSFDSDDLTLGVELFTPNVGDVILDAWVEIDTAWDGTTPKGDIGTFADATSGLFVYQGGPAIDLTVADNQDAGSGLLLGNRTALSVASGALGQRSAPMLVTNPNPIKFVVSQDGTAGGNDPSSSQGLANVYFVVATPVVGF